MTNLTLCSSTECPVKNVCYRSQAQPKKSQSYYDFCYTCNEDTGFVCYIPCVLTDVLIKNHTIK